VFKGRDEEFAADCDISDIRDYFGVSGGGLREDGFGPITTAPLDGHVYELVNIRPPASEKKREGEEQASIQTQHLTQHLRQRGFPGPKAEEEEEEEGENGKRAKDLELRDPFLEIETILKAEPVIVEKVNWLRILVFLIFFLFSLIGLLVHLYGYDAKAQLHMRERGDKMFGATIFFIGVGLFFSLLTVFHQDGDELQFYEPEDKQQDTKSKRE